MDPKQVEAAVGDLEIRVERLRQLYDQYFLGFEKLEPTIARRDVERKFEVLRRESIRNTGVRFRFQMMTQRYNTFATYWHRICRQIELGTYERHVNKAKKKFAAAANSVPSISEVVEQVLPTQNSPAFFNQQPSNAAPQPVVVPASSRTVPISTPRIVPIAASANAAPPSASANAAPPSASANAAPPSGGAAPAPQSAPRSADAPAAPSQAGSNANPKRIVIRKAVTRPSAGVEAAPPSSVASQSQSQPFSARPQLPPVRAPQASYVDIKLPPMPPPASRAPGIAPRPPPAIAPRAAGAPAPPPPMIRPSAGMSTIPASSEARIRAPIARPDVPISVKDSESRLRDPSSHKADESSRAAGPSRT